MYPTIVKTRHSHKSEVSKAKPIERQNLPIKVIIKFNFIVALIC